MASPSQINDFLGAAKPQDFYGEYNRLHFVIEQALNKMQTSTIVKVVSCTNNGGVSAVGFVDVIPQVKQIDANFKTYSHGIIHNIPYLRLQGGSNAIIIDPEPGDLGICVFANKDISNVKSTKNESAPGSYRRFNFSDGMYLGGLLNTVPANYIQFSNNTVTINTQNGVTINGNLTVNGSITGNEVTASGISLSNHVHSGVQSGGDNTGGPVS